MSSPTPSSQPSSPHRTTPHFHPPPLTRTSTLNSSSSLTPSNTAGHVLARQITNAISEEDLTKILSVQNETMQTLHKTSESLETFNNFSSARYAENLHQIQSYTKQLKEMKDDLDVVFKRIRTLKAKVATKHPAEYAEVMTRHEGEEEDDD